MRVCPKCGFVDPPYWKHCKWSYYIDDCSFENFQMLYPELAKELLKNRLAEDKYYAYRTQKKPKGLPQWVQRKAKIDMTLGWKDLVERFPHLHLKGLKTKLAFPSTHGRYCDFHLHWQLLHPSQSKLFEDSK